MKKALQSRKVRIAAASILGALSFAALTTSTVAWFKYGIDIAFGDGSTVPIKAGAEAAYFGGGDGTENKPYIISDRTHLYNLAWLQYIGTFNVDNIKKATPTVQIQELYFQITADIDMENLTLPPIGTETYPFFGHISGVYKDENNVEHVATISNLIISNDDPRPTASDFGITKPSEIPAHAFVLGEDSNHLTRAEGLFGVVGHISTNTTLSETDYYRRQYTFDDEGVATSSIYVDINGDPLGEGDSPVPIVPSVEDITLNNIVVQAGTHTAPNELLTGLAAGYFDGYMSGVKVAGESSIIVDEQTNIQNDITSNLSDYGLVGYAEDTGALGSYKQEISEYYDNQNDQDHDGDQWGGSVNMKDMWSRLNTLRGNTYAEATSNRVTHQYVYRKSYLDNEEEAGKYSVTGTNMTGSIARYNAYNNGTSAEIGNYAGSFNYARNVSNSTTKVYMQGGTYVEDYYYESDKDNGYFIKYDDTHYLNYTGTDFNANSQTNAPVWHFDGTGNSVRIYSINYNYNSTNRTQTITYNFLRNNDGVLAIRESNTPTNTDNDTRWTVTETTTDLIIESYSGSYRLVYQNGWKLLVNGAHLISGPDYYTIETTNGSYFPKNTTSGTDDHDVDYIRPGTSTTNSANAAHFSVNSNGNIYYEASNGTTYYLHVCRYGRRQNYTTELRLYTSVQTGSGSVGRYTYYYYPFTYNSSTGALTAASDSTYYLRLNGTTWTCSTTNYNISLTPNGGQYEYLTLPPRVSGFKTIRKLVDDQGEHMEFTSQDTTYFPLNAYNQLTKDKDGNVLGRKYDATAKNTGYVIAGTTDDHYDVMARSVIVSDYNRTEKIPYSTESVTVDGKTRIQLTDIKTINDSGIVTYTPEMIENLKRFNDNNGVYGSKTKFENILTSANGKIDGLHFSANKAGETFSIGKNNVVNATNVRVNQTNYSSYQLPVYSVDFNLSEQGVVNFFAGAYNGNSLNSSSSLTGPGGTEAKINSFFSLHKVYREEPLLDANNQPIIDQETGLPKTDPTIITDIKEIACIYSDPNADEGSPYIYTYKQYDANDDYVVVDENGSSTFDYSSYDLLFNTDWLMWRSDINTSDNRGYLYYFEIPIDGGEYCLGNVRDKNHTIEGCYLNYLDIAANGNENQAHITAYTITTTVSGYEFPLGVDFAIDGIGDDGGETVCVIISLPTASGTPNPSGTILFKVADDEISITDSLSYSSSYGYISSNKGDLFDLSSEDPPNDPPDPVPKISRVSYIEVDEVDGSSYYINIFETYKAVEETNPDTGTTTTVNKYVVDNITIAYKPVTGDPQNSETTDLDDLPSALTEGETNVLEDRIWDLVTAVTLTTGMTDIPLNAVLNGGVLPWEDENSVPYPYTYIITLADIPSDYEVGVTAASTGITGTVYVVTINGETIVLTQSGTTYIGTYPNPQTNP